ncbi:MAG: S8 family serine peptidase [Planctomycetota bacterium]
MAVPAVVLGSLLAVASFEQGDHDHKGHDCGLDAKSMQVRFEEATARVKGATLEMRDYSAGSSISAPVVAGELNVGLERGTQALAVAKSVGAELKLDLPRLGLATLRVADERYDATLAALRATKGVRFAEPNYVARAASTPNDPFLALQKGARHANVESAWNTTKGDPSVIVAVLDTGIDSNHPDLKNRVVAGWDFINNNATPHDDNGHGTTVAGIIAAEGDNAQGVVGVAYEARVMPIKVADGAGNASVANVAAGLDWAISHGAKVANVSLGTRVPAQALKDACDRAESAGLLVVAAAGNDPVHVVYYPAAYPNVVSVTSVSDSGELAFSAPVAPEIQVGAPGESIVSTYPGGLYGFVSGSSAAAAFTSGVAALCFSKNGSLTAAQVAQCLRAGQTPIAALAALAPVLHFGSLDAALALGRAEPAMSDVAITELRVNPAKPLPGQQISIVVQVANVGNANLMGAGVHVSLNAPGAPTLPASNVSVAMGERTEVTFTTTAPAAGTYTVQADIDNQIGETDLVNNRATATLVVNATAVVDLRVISRTVSDVNLATGTVDLGMTVENRGTAAATNVELALWIGATRIGSTVLPQVAVGQTGFLKTTWTIPTPAPAGFVHMRAICAPKAGETVLDDNQAVLDFFVGATGVLHGLYQQSNGVDVIPDAPWRVEPNRAYLPIQVFVPSKGSTATNTTLRVDRIVMTAKDDPAATTGTVLYDQAFGQAPSTIAAGLVIVDEMGKPRATKANELFGSVKLDQNGRHDIFRMPRAAYGVAAQPTKPVVKYTDVKLDWSYEETLFFGLLTTTRAGSHRAVLRSVFGSAPLPSLPGENHSHDVHHHTIAEWFFGSQLNVFAPRKAYGGPIQMVKESAYALGVIGAPDDVKDKIICTDHMCFYNTTIAGAQDADHRPPYGPTSVTAQPGTDSKAAYETIFGIGSGEEVAFKQDIPASKYVSSIPNVLSNLLPGIPIGAHFLLMRSEHIEGPWHGGGFLQGPGNPNINVDLFPLFDLVAKKNQGRNGGSFGYAAHPFSGQGWSDDNMDRAMGTDVTKRTREAVHDQTNKFVLKGLEFWNGRGTRSLDTSKIDFNDLNPWADADFVKGSSGWDGGVQQGLVKWHQMMATNLDYAFSSDPDTKFARKIYVAGGSDAHGDFGFSVSRAATPLSMQSTYYVGDDAWYGVRTYCLGDGKSGATPAERFMQAYEDGNSVMTDGPLVAFSMDADTRWDSTNLRWHAQPGYENPDGRIGGGGALDGQRTMLVRRGSGDLAYRYRYTNTADFGSNDGKVVAIKIYKTEAGNPNPTRKRGGADQLVGKNALATTGPDQDLTQTLDTGKEGAFSRPGCIALGAFTGVDPDVADLGPDEYRCYTNPVYATTYDVDAKIAKVDSATKTIPVGALTVTFTFDHSMSPSLLAAEVKAADTQGATTDKSAPALAALMPSGGANGWTDRAGVKSSVLTFTNAAAIPLLGDEFPAGSGNLTLALYLREPVRDAAGNALNTIATTVTAPRMGAAGPIAGSGGSSGGTGRGGRTAPGSTVPFSSKSGGGGGCAVTAATSGSDATGSLVLVLMFVLVLVRRRIEN